MCSHVLYCSSCGPSKQLAWSGLTGDLPGGAHKATGLLACSGGILGSVSSRAPSPSHTGAQFQPDTHVHMYTQCSTAKVCRLLTSMVRLGPGQLAAWALPNAYGGMLHCKVFGTRHGDACRSLLRSMHALPQEWHHKLHTCCSMLYHKPAQGSPQLAGLSVALGPAHSSCARGRRNYVYAAPHYPAPVGGADSRTRTQSS